MGWGETWLVPVRIIGRKDQPPDRKKGRRAGADPLVELCFLTPLAEGANIPSCRRAHGPRVPEGPLGNTSDHLRRYSIFTVC